MHSLKIKYWRDGIYFRVDYSANPKMEMLISFLLEIGGLVDLVKQDLASQGAFHFNVNCADLENNELALYSLYDEDDPPFTLKLSYKKFLNMLNNWRDVYQNYPAFIEITLDDDENIVIKAIAG